MMKFTVGMKIGGGFLIGALITITIGGIGLYANRTPSQALHYMSENSVPIVEKIHSLNYQRTMVRSYIYEIMASERDFNRVKKLQTLKQDLNDVLDAADGIWRELGSYQHGAKEQDLYNALATAYTEWRRDYSRVVDTYIERLIHTPDGPELTGVYDEYAGAVSKVAMYSYEFYTTLITFLNQNKEDLETLITENARMSQELGIVTLFFMALGIAAALILGSVMVRLITFPIKHTFVQLKAIAEGDLTQTIEAYGNDEIGEMMRLLQETQAGIKALIVTINNKAADLAGVGTELSAMMTQSAAAIHQISANTQGMKEKSLNESASVTETNATMGQIVLNINTLNKNIEEQAESISRSSASIEQMVANIASVTTSLMDNERNVKNLAAASEKGSAGLQQVSTAIRDVAKASERLLEINKVIQNIASQTNLLSMNAAIEAAHAGDVGRGFAVVADEIRKLAESSSAQAKTVSSVLKEIKGSLDGISASTDTVLVHFEAIDIGVKTVSAQESHIRAAIKEQDAGSKEILEAISRSRDITQNVRRGSEEMMTGSKEVIGEGKNLEALTADLTYGMNEIAEGMNQINTAVTRIQEISQENKQNIEVLVREITRFKIA
jgi:methyl-accepting chemotaxis protein